jgi:hypothetical protein
MSPKAPPCALRMKTEDEYELYLRTAGFSEEELKAEVTKHLAIINALGGYELLKVKEVVEKETGRPCLLVAGTVGIQAVLHAQVTVVEEPS